MLSRPLTTVSLLLWLIAPTAAAQTPGAWRAEVSGAFYSEAWDYNLSREEVLAGAIAIERAIGERAAVVAETAFSYAEQRDTANARIVSLTGLARWYAWNHRWAALFVESGVGVSRADAPVPGHGTLFNYVAQAGGGLMCRIRPRVSAVVGVRWLHLSNNNLAGRSRNPDVQALGARLGLRVQL